MGRQPVISLHAPLRTPPVPERVPTFKIRPGVPQPRVVFFCADDQLRKNEAPLRLRRVEGPRTLLSLPSTAVGVRPSSTAISSMLIPFANIDLSLATCCPDQGVPSLLRVLTLIAFRVVG